MGNGFIRYLVAEDAWTPDARVVAVEEALFVRLFISKAGNGAVLIKDGGGDFVAFVDVDAGGEGTGPGDVAMAG
jgi:hypothetical protein